MIGHRDPEIALKEAEETLKEFLDGLGEHEYLEDSISGMLKEGLDELYAEIEIDTKIGKKRRTQMLAKIRAMQKEIDLNSEL